MNRMLEISSFACSSEWPDSHITAEPCELMMSNSLSGRFRRRRFSDSNASMLAIQHPYHALGVERLILC
jgi:hypothetical protein